MADSLNLMWLLYATAHKMSSMSPFSNSYRYVPAFITMKGNLEIKLAQILSVVEPGKLLKYIFLLIVFKCLLRFASLKKDENFEDYRSLKL